MRDVALQIAFSSTARGAMQLDGNCSHGFTTTKSGLPAVRFMMSMLSSPSAISVPMAKIEDELQVFARREHALEFQAPDGGVEILVHRRAIADLRHLVVFIIVIERAEIGGHRAAQRVLADLQRIDEFRLERRAVFHRQLHGKEIREEIEDELRRFRNRLLKQFFFVA